MDIKLWSHLGGVDRSIAEVGGLLYWRLGRGSGWRWNQRLSSSPQRRRPGRFIRAPCDASWWIWEIENRLANQNISEEVKRPSFGEVFTSAWTWERGSSLIGLHVSVDLVYRHLFPSDEELGLLSFELKAPLSFLAHESWHVLGEILLEAPFLQLLFPLLVASEFVSHLIDSKYCLTGNNTYLALN